MYVVEYFEQIIAAFEVLQESLNKLCLHVHDELRNYSSLMANGEGGFEESRDKLIYALKQFEPNLKLPPQATETFPGAIACTENTIHLVKSVNSAKDKLRKVCEAYKTLFKRNPTKPIRDVLLKNGFGLVSLKQVYRHIHYVPYHPIRIAWTRVKAYMNVIISVQEAREALLNLGQGEHIDIQLKKLSLLSPDIKLVKQRKIKPCSAVNITAIDEIGRKQNQKITTGIPIFYLFDNSKENPFVCFSAKATRGNSSTRSDKKIEADPFLKSINVYRYQEDVG